MKENSKSDIIILKKNERKFNLTDTFLFDLDGTLVPIFQDDFGKYYFIKLLEITDKLGIDAETIKIAIFGGMQVMVANDGSSSNEDKFWQWFEDKTNVKKEVAEPIFLDFYKDNFDKIKEYIKITDTAKKIIDYLNKKNYKVILATNPIFPIQAVETRMNWVGLKKEDFDYITVFSNSSYCKPNPLYFDEIIKKNNLIPENCIMVGNNVIEDIAAEKVGIKTYLITDYLENEKNLDYSNFEHSSLLEFYEKIQKEY